MDAANLTQKIFTSNRKPKRLKALHRTEEQIEIHNQSSTFWNTDLIEIVSVPKSYTDDTSQKRLRKDGSQVHWEVWVESV